jgi:Mor family transcriptional regulator
VVILKNEEWIKDVTPDQLPEPYDRYAEAIGVKSLLNLSKELGGITVYIPKPENLFKDVIFKNIKKEFNGYNHQKLALKYSLSERTIRNIVAEDTIIKGQLTMFDE